MLIDFCHHSVGSAIKTDKVSFDGYEIENLLSSNPRLKNQGFMSDHFVKPPVNISVQFPCCVSLYRIVIDPVIGRQQSNDIKVFTASKKLEDTWLYGGSNNSVQIDGLLFNQVAFVRETNPNLICLQSHVFKPSRLWRIDNNQIYSQYKESGELRSSKPGALSNVSHVNICVLRTKSGSSAAIKKLEIWGMPSMTTPKDIQDKLRKAYVNIVWPAPKPTADLKVETCLVGVYSNKMKDLDESCDNDGDSIAVPDDFKDQITYEIMACPILLPSGKNIDQSTLDKFVNSEASWGRPPGDPFTGLEFTQGRQPISNIALKSRIDDFTFKHADQLNVPKTLGRLNKKTKMISSSRLTALEITTDKYTGPKKRKIISDFTEHNAKHFKQTGVLNKSQFELNKSVADFKQSCSPILDKQTLPSKPGKSHSSNIVTKMSDIRTRKSQSISSNARGHTDILNFSLDDALKSALGNLPTFTSQLQQNKAKSHTNTSMEIKSESTITNDFVCNKCGTDCNNSDVIKYRITCEHLICRTCLNAQSQDRMICFLCKVCYKRGDIVRVF